MVSTLFQACLRLSLLHIHTLLPILVLKCLFHTSYTFWWVISYKLTLKHCYVILTHFLGVLETKFVALTHLVYMLYHGELFLYFFKSMVGHELQPTPRHCFVVLKVQTLFEQCLCWFETTFVSLTHLVGSVGLQVLFSHFLNLLVGYKLRIYA